MPAYTPLQIKSKTAMARKVVKHHFGKSLEKIEFKPAGKTNFVFDVATKEGNFIVRIANSRAKLNDFMKEQWATQKALSVGVPVPEILEVGHDLISLPYMLQQKNTRTGSHQSSGQTEDLAKAWQIYPPDPLSTNNWFWKSI